MPEPRTVISSTSVKVEGGHVIVRVPTSMATVPSDDAFMEVSADFGADQRAALAWAANVLDWLGKGGSFNPERALNLYGKVAVDA